MIYIKNPDVYTPYEIIKKAHLLIQGAKIYRISKRPFEKLPRGARVIDAPGKILCPGFIDMHLQGAGGSDFLDGTKEALFTISRAVATYGTTSLLATTVFKNGKNPHIENIVKERSKVKGERVKGAQLLGIHLEGPFVNPKKKGMIRPNGIRNCSMSYFDRILDATNGRLKMMTIAPELKGAIQIIKRLRRKKIVPSFGHSEATYQEAVMGIGAGISHATHIFNAMRPLYHREPAAIAALLTDDKVSVQLISDGIHIHPAVIKIVLKLKGVKNIVLITDSMSSQGLPDGTYVYDGWRYESKAGQCRYKDGTLIGTALPLNKMIRRMMEFSGVSLLEAIQMATINPARVLGIQAKKGAVEKGKDADLVIMDKNLNVHMTLVGGTIVYEKRRKKL